jgi:hypothetical protein
MIGIILAICILLGLILGLLFSIKTFPYREIRRLYHIFKSKEKKQESEWLHYRDKVDHNYRDVVKPNCETLYSSTFVNASGSYSLSVPATKSYFSITFLNSDTDVLGYVTNEDLHYGQLVLTTTSHNPKPGVIPLPAGLTWIVARLGMPEEEDLEAVHQWQNQLKIVPIDN